MRALVAAALAACWLLPALASTEASVSAGPSQPSAVQIVERNAAARGGWEAWRRIGTMAWAGHAESTGAPGRKVPFLLEQKRPGRMRFEILTPNQRSVRVFDGTHGWKIRTGRGGLPEVRPYGDDELAFVRDAQTLEGPLMAATAKGYALTLEGAAEVGGRKAYPVSFRPRPDAVHRVWIDAETFLELRYEREFRTAAGRQARATVEYHDYRTFEGLQIPVRIETGSGPGKAKDTLVIERVALNPKLPDAAFEKPRLPANRRRGVVVDTRVTSPPPAR